MGTKVSIHVTTSKKWANVITLIRATTIGLRVQNLAGFGNSTFIVKIVSLR